MQLLLIRHAQSANNANDEELRVPDPGLTALGHQQAEKLAEWLATVGARHLWCSAFLRALETTEPTRKRLQLTPEIFEDLHELGGCYSGWKPGEKQGAPGMKRAELSERFPDYSIDPVIDERGWWYSRPFETREQATERARRVARRFAAKSGEVQGPVVAVIHADFKRLLMMEMLGHCLDVSQIGPLCNAGVTRLEWTGDRWRLHALNSISHLPSDWITH